MKDEMKDEMKGGMIVEAWLRWLDKKIVYGMLKARERVMH